MRFRVLACDYDGTLATSGTVSGPTLEALRSVIESGRRLVLVTGRTLDELLDVFTELDLFDRLVIENGAVLLHPTTREEEPLAEPVAAALIDSLRDRGVHPLAVGRVICATRVINYPQVAEAVRELGLDYELAINRDSVMVQPHGVTKATGLDAALRELGESRAVTAAVGDGENDMALTAAAAVSAAVANAVDALKDQCDIVLDMPNGGGIRQLCDSLIAHDLADLLRREPQRRAG